MITDKLQSIKARNILYIASFTAIASLAEGTSEAEKDPSFYNIPAPIVSKESSQVSSGLEKSQGTDTLTASEEKKPSSRFQNIKKGIQSKFEETKKDIKKKIDKSETAQRALKTGKNVIKDVKQSPMGKKLGLDTRNCEQKVADLKAKEIEARKEAQRLEKLQASAKMEATAFITSDEYQKACIDEDKESLRLTPSCLIKLPKLIQYGRKAKDYEKKAKAKSTLAKELNQQAKEMKKSCPKIESGTEMDGE
jgi:hypothetical protein